MDTSNEASNEASNKDGSINSKTVRHHRRVRRTAKKLHKLQKFQKLQKLQRQMQTGGGWFDADTPTEKQLVPTNMVQYGPSFPQIMFKLGKEQSICGELSSMSYMHPSITHEKIQTMNSLFSTIFVGTKESPSNLAFSKLFPGEIKQITIRPGEILLVCRNACFCATPNVNITNIQKSPDPKLIFVTVAPNVSSNNGTSNNGTSNNGTSNNGTNGTLWLGAHGSIDTLKLEPATEVTVSVQNFLYSDMSLVQGQPGQQGQPGPLMSVDGTIRMRAHSNQQPNPQNPQNSEPAAFMYLQTIKNKSLTPSPPNNYQREGEYM